MARQNDKTDLWTVVEVMEVSGALTGKRFSITGHLAKPRKDIINIIQQAGGIFEERPRWGVHFLICNHDWNPGTTIKPKKSSKLIEAERNGIRVISESEFCQMLIDADAARQAEA